MIIGLAGENCSGKDVSSEILERMAFKHYSLSDVLRERLSKEKKELSRDNLFHKGNELRAKHGASVLAKLTLEKVKDGENYVFTSIRNPKEAELLMEREDFLLVEVICPEKVRLRRILERNREGDPKTLAELREKEKREKGSNPNNQQLHLVAKMAKIKLINDSTLEVLESKLKKLVEDWLFKLQDSRPSWDDYFMDIAEQVKLRATCMSAKKAAIIVKNKMIVSTGYNGSPKGIMHCTEGGCQRCTSRHLGKLKSGNYSEPCICCHSEENAIVQAAYNGVSTKEGVMYTTFTPCSNCAKMIINAGIKEVVCKVVYPDDIGTALLKNAGVKLRLL